jgi:hypothetical protein
MTVTSCGISARIGSCLIVQMPDCGALSPGLYSSAMLRSWLIAANLGTGSKPAAFRAVLRWSEQLQV